MVWAGVTSDGRTPLVFIPQGVKINQYIYRESILESILKPWAQKHFGSRPWTFQQDSVPAHRARATQEWCKQNCPAYISSDEWPPLLARFESSQLFYMVYFGVQSML